MQNPSLQEGTTDQDIDDQCVELTESEQKQVARDNLEAAMSDPMRLWELLGPDGIEYPNSPRYQARGFSAPIDAAQNCREYEAEVEGRIRTMALMYFDGDDQGATDLGKMLLNQLMSGVE